MSSEVFVTSPLVLLLVTLLLATGVVLIVRHRRRRHPPRGFDVKPVLPLEQGERER